MTRNPAARFSVLVVLGLAGAAFGQPAIWVDDEVCGNAPPGSNLQRPVQPEGPATYTVSPLFYDASRGGKLTIEVKPFPTNLEQVRLFATHGASTLEVPMNDDGVAPDKRRGDGIWTGEYIRALGEIPSFRWEIDATSQYFGTLGASPIWPVDDPEEVSKGSKRFQFTPTLINVRSKRILRQARKDYLASGRVSTAPYRFRKQHVEEIMSIVTTEFGDIFDFLVLVNAGEQAHGNRHYQGESNAVEGIGLPTFTSGLEASDTLQGRVTYPIASLFPGGSVLLHEIGHRWLVFLPDPYRSGAHWPVGSVASCSIMGISFPNGQGGQFPFRFDEKGDQFDVTCDPNCKMDEFSPIELYVMGLVKARRARREEYVFEDQDQELPTCPSGQTAWSGPVERFNAARLVEELGERVPDARASQKSFRMAVVFVSRKLLSKPTMEYYSEVVREEAATFDAATGGKGVLLPGT